MAKIQLGDWGTYYAYSGTGSPEAGDWQTRWLIKYEQDLNNAKTKIYVQPYLKIHVIPQIETFTVPSMSIKTTINGEVKTQTISGGTYKATSEGSNYFYKYGTTQEFTISHDSNGGAQCKFSGAMTNTSYGISRTASHTWDLPSININSSISNNTTANSRIEFGKDVAFTIARPNDTITHTLKYIVDGTEYTIGTGIGESKSYAFPTSLINKYPSNEEVAITVTCTSSNGTTSSTIVYLKIPDSYVPAISLALSEVGSVPSSWGIYVKGKSKIKGIISASGSGGSTIKSYSANANNQTFNTSEFITSELNNSGTLTIKASVTDSRGRPASTSKSITVYDYSTPTYVKIEVIRCDASGNEDNDGTYGKVVCQYSISSCNNKNSKSLQVSYGSITKTFTLNNYSGTITASASQLFSGLDVTANHTFTFKLIDSFSEITQPYIMPPSFVLISKLAGGKGLTIGQIATEEGFHVYMASDFHDGISIDGVPILEYEVVDTW